MGTDEAAVTRESVGVVDTEEGTRSLLDVYQDVETSRGHREVSPTTRQPSHANTSLGSSCTCLKIGIRVQSNATAGLFHSHLAGSE